ncbi:AbiH family protein, partial [Psychrobacter sp. 1Y4]|uniref:AbiH family protein n=1 Tax=Psychrobacter sp. 1Y4 TaxID=3453575 RepID=UPI003F46222A
MDTKKIFVLGNGFDLAHYLPTAYVHFMDAMRVVEGSEENAELGFDNLFHKYISGDCSEIDKEFFQKTKKLYKTDDLQLSPDKVKELRGNLKSNGWFQHFKHHLTDVDTWIDFENEIQKLLISVCDLFDFEFNENTVDYWDI